MKRMRYNKFIVGFLIGLSFFIKISVAHAKTVVDMQTNYGLITIQLEDDIAPITVSNFLTYVDEGFYEDLIFHRIIEGFMSQGGGFNETLQQQTPHAPIALESNVGLQNNRGTIAMARTSVPDSATSQFFINAIDNNFLDYSNTTRPGYAVFGTVIEGMEVVDEINKVATGANDVPLENVVIEVVRRREAQLSFVMQSNYRAGDSFKIQLEETMPRSKELDLWVAILMLDGSLLFATEQGFSTVPVAFKTAVATTETNHLIYSVTVPAGLTGEYTIAAIFNKAGANLDDLMHSLRSNFAQVTIKFVQ
jgi:cyclophilin family peptidyl-prolyl cis-trans isomerase